jgi:hypothetical protein
MTAWIIGIWTMRRPIAFALMFIVAVVFALVAANAQARRTDERRELEFQRELLGIHNDQIHTLQAEQTRLHNEMVEWAAQAQKGPP